MTAAASTQPALPSPGRRNQNRCGCGRLIRGNARDQTICSICHKQQRGRLYRRSNHIAPEQAATLRRLLEAGATRLEMAYAVGRSKRAVELWIDAHAAAPDAPVHQVRERRCLGCGDPFRSVGPHNRVCDPCKSRDSWSDPLPAACLVLG